MVDEDNSQALAGTVCSQGWPPYQTAFLGFDAACGSEQWVEEVGGTESSKTQAGHGNLSPPPTLPLDIVANVSGRK